MPVSTLLDVFGMDGVRDGMINGVRGLASPDPLAGAAQHVAGMFGGASQYVAGCVWSGQCTRWPEAWGQGLGIT